MLSVMNTDQTDKKDESNVDQVDMIIRLQQSEAGLSCSRNNYFIVITSLLILALSQFKNQNLQLFIQFSGIGHSFCMVFNTRSE